MDKKEAKTSFDAIIEKARREEKVFALPNGVWSPSDAECLQPLDDDWDDFLNDLEKAMCEDNTVENWDALVGLMDDEIREAVHSRLCGCIHEDFLKEYARLHEQKYGEEFPPSQM